MEAKQEITKALEMLGELLEDRGYHFDLVIVGGAALLLLDLISRSTLDLDALAVIAEGNRWKTSKPLPVELVTAIRDVADALDLPRQPRDEKDWLNAGPSMLLQMGLPPGFKTRVTIQRFGGLTVRIASRVDLIYLKLWSATATARGARRKVDVDDLRKLRPTREELRSALQWCAQKDGRPDFIRREATQVINKLGFNIADVRDG